MLKIECNYTLKKDLEFILDTEKITTLQLSEKTKIPRTVLDEILNGKTDRDDICEELYSFIYKKKFRINSVKEELNREKYRDILFHGSRDGLEEVSVDGSKSNCDFGNGFYLGETYSQALSFTCEKEGSSVYSFKYSLQDLKVKNFECNLEWMLAICYYRGTLGKNKSDSKIQSIIKEIEESDVIIAPIADNKMFYIMSQFTEGEINADVALHSLSASRLGLQYVFKTEKALSNLNPIEKYYISGPEREDYKKLLNERSFEIDTKLKLAKREFKDGLFIEEIFK